MIRQHLRENLARTWKAMDEAGLRPGIVNNRGHMVAMAALTDVEVDFSHIPHPHQDGELATALGFVEARVANQTGSTAEGLAQIFAQKQVGFNGVLATGWVTSADKTLRQHTVALAADGDRLLGVVDSMHEDGFVPHEDVATAAAHIDGLFDSSRAVHLSLALDKSTIAERDVADRSVWLGSGVLAVIPGIGLPPEA